MTFLSLRSEDMPTNLTKEERRALWDAYCCDSTGRPFASKAEWLLNGGGPMFTNLGGPTTEEKCDYEAQCRGRGKAYSASVIAARKVEPPKAPRADPVPLKPELRPVSATPYEWRDPATIPPRR